MGNALRSAGEKEEVGQNGSRGSSETGLDDTTEELRTTSHPSAKSSRCTEDFETENSSLPISVSQDKESGASLRQRALDFGLKVEEDLRAKVEEEIRELRNPRHELSDEVSPDAEIVDEEEGGLVHGTQSLGRVWQISFWLTVSLVAWIFATGATIRVSAPNIRERDPLLTVIKLRSRGTQQKASRNTLSYKREQG